MIKHGYCPTCGTFTAAASYVTGTGNREERDDFLTDAELAQQLHDAMADLAGLDPKAVTLGVLNAVVTLTGRVADKDQKWRLAQIAYSHPAVQDVINHLEIASRSEPRNA